MALIRLFRDYRHASCAILLQNYPNAQVIDAIASELARAQADATTSNGRFKIRFVFQGGVITLRTTRKNHLCRIDFSGERRALLDSLRTQILTALEGLTVPPVRRPQFSLRTLVLAGLFLGSIIGLHWRWDPWVLQHRFMCSDSDFLSLSFSPDGRCFLTTGGDGIVRIWSAEDGHLVHTLVGRASLVHFACYSPSGQRVLTTSADGTAIVWDANSAQRLATLKGQKVGIQHCISTAFFAPRGEQAATIGMDGTICLWNSTNGDLLKIIRHGNGALRGRYSPDGAQILSLGTDGTLRCWDANTGEALGPTIDQAYGFEVSPDGRTLLVYSDIGAAVVDMKDDWRTTPFEVYGLGPDATFSRDGKLVALHQITERKSWPVWIYDVQTAKFMAFIDGGSVGLSEVAFDARGDRILTGSTNAAEIWDAATGERLSRIGDSQTTVSTVTWMPDDERVLVSRPWGECQIYEQQRPESLWGIRALPEFWLTLIFGGAVIWSLIRA